MSLEQNTKDRLANSRLVQLTNFNSSTASAVDDAVLTNAATAAKGYFKFNTGLEYSDTNNDHVTLSVPLVELVLQQWTGRWADLDQLRWSHVFEQLEIYGQGIGAMKRVLPQTKSGLTVTQDKRGSSRTVKPKFDSTRFDNISPQAPRRGAWGDSSEEVDD